MWLYDCFDFISHVSIPFLVKHSSYYFTKSLFNYKLKQTANCDSIPNPPERNKKNGVKFYY